MNEILSKAINDAVAITEEYAQRCKKSESAKKKSAEEEMQEIIGGCSCKKCVHWTRTIEIEEKAEFKAEDGSKVSFRETESDIPWEARFQLKRLINGRTAHRRLIDP